jgi:hypothetical protein
VVAPVFCLLYGIACFSVFLEPLARSHGWQKLFLISPWISEFGVKAGMSVGQLVKRLKDDNATAYIVTTSRRSLVSHRS